MKKSTRNAIAGIVVLITIIVVVTIRNLPSGGSIQAEINTASDGDTIQVQPGTYNERLNITKSITIICAETKKCIIKGATISGTAIVVDGFASIKNDSNSGGFHISGDNNILRNSLIDESCMSGVIVTGQYNLIENNEVMHSRQCLGMTSGPDADGMRNLNSNNTYRNNYIHDISKAENPTAHIDGIQGDYQNYQFKNVLIEDNIIDVPDAGVQTDGINCDGVTISRNTIRAARPLNMSCLNIVITDNIIHGLPGSSFIGIRSGSSNVTFTGNIVCNTTDGIIVPSGVVIAGGGNTFWNNSGDAPRRDSGYSYLDGNLLWPTDQWQIATPPVCSEFVNLIPN